MATGEEYLAAQMVKAVAPEKVATAIVNAATRRSPRARYLVPARSKPLITLLSALPDRLADRAKRQALGLGGSGN